MNKDFDVVLREVLNKHSMENASNTPDYILATFLMDSLVAINQAIIRRDQSQATKLSPSEALYGFASWLTTRKEAITLGSVHDASGVCALVSSFCKEHNLPDPREGWEKRLNPRGQSDG